MSRKDALLKLFQRLLIKRDALRETLGMGTCDHYQEVGDLADNAAEDVTNEMSSQLASIETDELHLVERAIELLRSGRYGSCDDCGIQIPIARLQAVPYSVTCVKCQEYEEQHGRRRSEDADWEKACNYEGRINDEDIQPERLKFKFDE